MTTNEQVKRLEVRMPRGTQFTGTSYYGFDAEGNKIVTEYNLPLGYTLSNCFAKLRVKFPNAEIVEV